MNAGPWELLGLRPDADERSVKRAYAALLKKTRPEDDPEGYQRLRETYDHALALARRHAAQAEPVAEAAVVEAAVVEAPEVAAADVEAREASVAPAMPDEMALRRQAWNDAAPLWQDFLEHWRVSPRLKLDRIAGGGSPLSLLGHEALEVMAARCCATDDCDPGLRETVVEYFGWHEDCRHLERIDGDTVHHVLGRYRADQALLKLYAHCDAHVLGALIANEPPRFAWRLADSSFVNGMRQAVQLVRWQAPELLHFRLDPTVFEWWEQRVLAPRITLQLIVLCLVAGLVLFGISAGFTAETLDEWGWWQFLGCEAAALAAGVWMTFKARPLAGALLRFKAEHADRLLFGDRHLLGRYGWLVPFAVVSLAMFVPEPGAILVTATAVGMVACAIAALYGASPALTMQGYAMVAFLGMLLSGFMNNMFPGHHVVATVGMAICLQTLLQSRGMRQHDLGVAMPRLGAVRAGWLLGSAALFLAPYFMTLPAGAVPFLWLWVLGGVVIGSFSARALIALPAYVVLWVLASARRYSMAVPPEPSVVALQSLLLAAAVYMALSLWRDRRAD
ncbi:J domain-containing protein [Pseudoduganella lutea]|uniref:J domain-containing protein n=1 Tax=Pseudoduganella lutea TaxID=321985 RepID=UPI001A91391B|nr:J domain-containing protein [Pseudoduganella lutea]